MSVESPGLPGWKELVRLALEEVRSVIQSLPPPLRARAEALPLTCEHAPSRDLVDDGIEPDTLGLFVGSAFEDEETAPSPIPAQIILFLDNIMDMAEGDLETFKEETRTTLLHELGHYLGLNEDELFDRGLE